MAEPVPGTILHALTKVHPYWTAACRSSGGPGFYDHVIAPPGVPAVLEGPDWRVRLLDSEPRRCPFCSEKVD